jgi:hypothetical protein
MGQPCRGSAESGVKHSPVEAYMFAFGSVKGMCEQAKEEMIRKLRYFVYATRCVHSGTLSGGKCGQSGLVLAWFFFG